MQIDLPNQIDHMDALRAARVEMETISCEVKIRKSLNHDIPPAADLFLEVGQRVLVAREGAAVAAGPFEIVEMRSRSLYTARRETASSLILRRSALTTKTPLKRIIPTYHLCFFSLNSA